MKRINNVNELEVGKSYLIFEAGTFDLKLTLRADGFMEPTHGTKIIAFNAKQFFQNPAYEVFGPAHWIEYNYAQIIKRCALQEGAEEGA